ncbi:MAG: hypothetical protein U0930_07065 [Pirellulales bacterium]
MTLQIKSTQLATTLLATCALLLGIQSASADQFILKDGRVIAGTVVSSQAKATANPDKKSALTDEELVIEVEPDVQVVIRKSELALNGTFAKDERLKIYEAGTAKLTDTVEAHTAAVQWADSNGQKELRNAHYWRILDLDPENSVARAGLEHINDSGQWERMEDRMHRQGKVKVKSKWIFPETLELENEDYDKRFKEYKALTNITKNNIAQATAKIEKVDDPVLADVISERLADKHGVTTKLPEPVKLFFISQLARLHTGAGIRALAVCALDPSQVVRNAAIQALLEFDDKDARRFASNFLIQALGSNDNARINLAGFALGKLEAEEAILPLIGRLTSKHEIAINEGDTFSPDGGLQYNKPKKQIVIAKNEGVLGALSQITKQGFGYERADWISWYASIHAKSVADLRRDP